MTATGFRSLCLQTRRGNSTPQFSAYIIPGCAAKWVLPGWFCVEPPPLLSRCRFWPAVVPGCDGPRRVQGRCALQRGRSVAGTPAKTQFKAGRPSTQDGKTGRMHILRARSRLDTVPFPPATGGGGSPPPRRARGAGRRGSRADVVGRRLPQHTLSTRGFESWMRACLVATRLAYASAVGGLPWLREGRLHGVWPRGLASR